MVRIVLLSGKDLSTHALTPGLKLLRIRSLSGLIKGKKVEDALKLTNSAVVEALEGLPPVKVHCSVLAEEAVKTAVADYYNKIGRPVDFEIEKGDDEHH